MARHFKGSISVLDLDQLPLYELQTVYYQFWKDKLAEAEMTDEEKGATALGRMIEDNI